jgi:hypothetical protein
MEREDCCIDAATLPAMSAAPPGCQVDGHWMNTWI